MSDSSDSDLRDLSDLEMLSDWNGSESDADIECVSVYKLYKPRMDHFNTLNSCEFQLRFRLDKPSVESLLHEIYPAIRVKGARNFGIHPLHQVLLTLRFYALGSMLSSVADFVGVSKSSASRIIRDVSWAIAQLSNKYIYIHTDTEQDFYKIARFPHVLGLLDGTHIKIQSPSSEVGEKLRNQNGYYSLNVQAVCNANLLFMDFIAHWPGSYHDDTIFSNSDLKAQCETGKYGNKWLLADSAYPLKPYLLTPVLNPQTKGEKLYNEAHSKTRNCIDRCFNVWKRRFPVVSLTFRICLLRVKTVLMATAVLHNICRLNGLVDVPPEIEIPPTDDIVTVANTSQNNSTERTKLISEVFDN